MKLWPMPCSVQFSPWVMADSATPSTAARQGPCSSPTPGTCSNSCTSRWWCHPTISFSVVPFSSCLQFFRASGTFQRVSSSHQVDKVLEFQLKHQSVLPMNIQGWFTLGWIFNTTVQKRQFFGTQLFFIVQLSHPYMTTGKTIALTRWIVGKVISTF